MATNQSGYQLPNPQALDPYSIETALVNKLEPQYALGELNAYRADRGIAEQGYQRELDAQHEQARKQLEGTMANNAAERWIGAAAHPELLAAMQGNPQFSWMFGPDGRSPSPALSQLFNQQTRLQNANIAEKGANATEKLAIAGLPTTTAGATGITGLPTYMDDSINVKAAAARGNELSDSIPMYMGTDNGQPIHFPIKQLRNATPEQQDEVARAAARTAKRMYPNLQPTAGVQRLLQGSPAAPTAPSGGATAPAAPGYVGPGGKLPLNADGTPKGGGTNELVGPVTDASPDGSAFKQFPGLVTGVPPAPTGGGAQAAPPAAPNQTNLTPAPQQPAKPPAQQATPASMPRQDLLPSEAIRDRQIQSIAQRWMASQPQNVREDVARRMLEAKLGGNLAIVQHPGDPGVLIILGMNGSYPMRLKK